MDIVIRVVLVLLIIIFGGIGVYLAEYQHQGTNITNLGNALWWAVVTISTVGYGDFYPTTIVGRAIAVFVMFSGIGIFVLLISALSQRRLQRVQSRLKLKTEVQQRLLGDETKTALKNKIEEIEKLTDEDFEALIVMMRRVRRTLLEESRNLYRCPRCSTIYYSKPKFCSNCGLGLT